MRRSLLLFAFLFAIACQPGSFLLAGGGIGGTGLSQGPITGFGSIFVTGVEWDLGAAQIIVDGVPASERDLRLGMIVTVEGEFEEGESGGNAMRVVFDADLEGPIAAIDPDPADPDVVRLTVLGQTVVVEAGVTDFEDTTFADLALDDVVEVSGFAGPDAIRATRVEHKGALELGITGVELEGFVEGLSGNFFRIGSVEITFGANVDVSDFAGGVPQGLVEVEGTLIRERPDGVVASRIHRVEGLPDVDAAEIEGIVTDFNGAGSFRVAGQLVDASGAQFEGSSAALLANGVRVEVEGEISGGVLNAEEVKLRGDEARIRAAVADDGDVDPGGGTLHLLGIEIRTDASTRLEGGLALGNIRAGDFLEVRGLPVDTGTVLAERIKREDDTDDVELRGRVDEFGAPDRSFTILGVRVLTDDQTVFEDVADQDEFYSVLALGDLLEVTDVDDDDATAIDFADEVEFEEEDD